jgi:hypothetical protein
MEDLIALDAELEDDRDRWVRANLEAEEKGIK